MTEPLQPQPEPEQGGEAEAEDDDDDELLRTPDGSVAEDMTPIATTIRRNNHSIPVGITIAYKRQAAGVMRETPAFRTSSTSHNKDHSGVNGPTVTAHQEARDEKPRRKSSSWQVFLDSALIYIVCLIFPSLLGYAYQCYTLWKQETVEQQEEKASSSSWLYYYVFGESSLYRWMVREVYQPEVSAWCDAYSDDDSKIWSSIAYAAQCVGLCPAAKTISLFSNDLLAWSDSFSISVFSCIIAILRITIVHFTVPLDDSQELEAMVRCKSMHLLSSDYVVTPVGTPVRPRRLYATTTTTTTITTLQLPVLDANDMSNHHLNNEDESSAFMIDDSVTVHLESIGTGGPQHNNQGSLADDTKQDDGDDDIDFDEQLLEKLAKATTTTTNQQTPGSTISTSGRMYAGPRYATALFRLLYSTFAAGIALWYFRTADFWPWYVFGNGSSRQCWDLSGGLAVTAMDSDFDQRNSSLKRYFLWQASYHWHSAAFHILSMLILMLHPTKHAPRRFMSLQKGTTMYIRRLFQHALAIALIGIAYVFSSLRRLGAIGLFAFDVSSCCLHLLQLCINAPEDSRWSRSSTIAGVFWILVVPSFVLARFAIWPAIWYSAAFESKAWLQQLEKTLWPGSAATIRYAMHGLMAALQVLSVIYFQRLFNLEHVKRILNLGNIRNTTTSTTTARATASGCSTRKLFVSKSSL